MARANAVAVLLACGLAVSCNFSTARESTEARAPAPTRKVKVDHPGLPLEKLTERELQRFKEGDGLFEATVRESDGLGPLYVRDACAACHASDGRGPGLVMKVAPKNGDPTLAAKLLPFGSTERPYATAGAKTALLAPAHPELQPTPRLPPAVFGRGFLEAISDQDIERLAKLASERTGAERGRINRLKTGSIGRFGLKARLATLHDFAADALSSDMGVSSPSRPEEPAGPEGLRDDAKPGVDFNAEQVTLLAEYVRVLQIPKRQASSVRGPALFAAARCSVCHTPSFTTSTAFPVKALAGVSADVYTDLLLHDMGAALSDGLTEEGAGPREFRTAPLIGLRFLPSLLHDGRARNVSEAIAAHGEADSEGRDSVTAFKALPERDQQELVKFVESL
ncbi:MAG TPA: di-heme oxidoredictase family protein [Polyangiaceae bacterium]|nr:di-heme oxidoredictase family protein [Polyangiaceae bacterium]